MPIRLADWAPERENKRKTFSLFILILLPGDAERLFRKVSQDVKGQLWLYLVFRLFDKFSLSTGAGKTFLLSVYFSKAFSNPKCFIVGCCGVWYFAKGTTRQWHSPVDKVYPYFGSEKGDFYVGKVSRSKSQELIVSGGRRRCWNSLMDFVQSLLERTSCLPSGWWWLDQVVRKIELNFEVFARTSNTNSNLLYALKLNANCFCKYEARYSERTGYKKLRTDWLQFQV